MNRLAVLEQDNPQYAVSHFWDSRLAANSPVGLDFLTQWVSDDLLNPFMFDNGAVGAPAGVLKILRGFHLL
ncbi:MAG: hypothetical protein OHK0041_24910 [Anaerolineales bacterium]